jgi:hypothetical protein
MRGENVGMRRTLILLILGCLLLLAACGDNTLAPASSTGEAAPSTTATSSTTTTTLAPTTTTTTVEITPSTTDGIDGFSEEAGTPQGELDSFTGRFDATLDIMGMSMAMTTNSTYVGSAYECVTSMDMGGMSMEMTVVATPDTLWIDSGSGFQESNLFDSDVQSVTGICPASPMFWTAFGEAPWGAMSGEPDTINGIPVQRLDMTSMAGGFDLGALDAFFGGVGALPDGIQINEMVFWIADPGGWPVALQVGVDLSESAVAELVGMEGLGAASMTMSVEIDNVNDPALSVQVPPA